jgi:hypothetical protein
VEFFKHLLLRHYLQQPTQLSILLLLVVQVVAKLLLIRALAAAVVLVAIPRHLLAGLYPEQVIQ